MPSESSSTSFSGCAWRRRRRRGLTASTATVPMAVLVAIMAIVTAAHAVHARDHSFSLSQDDRQYLIVDNFGYEKDGEIVIRVTDFGYSDADHGSMGSPVGFLLAKDLSPDNFLALQEGSDVQCLQRLLDKLAYTVDLRLPDSGQHQDVERRETVTQDGLYTLFYYSCAGPGVKISFSAHIQQINPGGNHLSVGLMPLPLIYWIFTGIFGAMSGYWLFRMLANRQNVYKIHWLMALLVLLKFASLLFDALRYEHIKAVGSPQGFAVPYYLFAIPKGTILFVVILLVGAGWSFLKPILSSKDKRIFMIVLPVQVFVNVALAVVEEMVQTYTKFMLWRDILRMIDFACCIAVLVPVVMTIRQLSGQSAEDGRTLRNVEKLRKFRAFYLITILFLYFTRVVVVLMVSALGYKYEWMAALFTEIAACAYYGWSGFQFRPMAENPYLMLDDDEQASGDTELGPVSTQMEFEDDDRR